jgi:hypothetical protein
MLSSGRAAGSVHRALQRIPRQLGRHVGIRAESTRTYNDGACERPSVEGEAGESALEECPICFEERRCAEIEPCGHSVCVPCARRLLLVKPRCPWCRQTVFSLGGRESARFLDERVVLVHLADAHAGVTLSSVSLTRCRPLEDAARSPTGVRVTCCRQRDAAYAAGLRVNDVIYEINGVPVDTHDAAISVIESTKVAGRTARCLVSRSSHSCMCPAC